MDIVPNDNNEQSNKFNIPTKTKKKFAPLKSHRIIIEECCICLDTFIHTDTVVKTAC